MPLTLTITLTVRGKNLVENELTTLLGNRREVGYCQICWNTDTITDISLSGAGTKAVTKKASAALACGSYGIKGTASIEGGYDAILIPGAMKKTGTVVKAVCQAGGSKGLVTATGTTTKTICCKYKL